MSEHGAGEHAWYELRLTGTVVTACRICGTIRRRDGGNRPCRGIAAAAPAPTTPQAEGDHVRRSAAALAARLRAADAGPALLAEAAGALTWTADAYAVAAQQNAGLLEAVEQLRHDLQAAERRVAEQAAELARLRRRYAA